MRRKDRRRERDKLRKEKERKAKEDADAALKRQMEAVTAVTNGSNEGGGSNGNVTSQPQQLPLDEALPDETALMLQLGFASFATTKVCDKPIH